MRDPKSLLRSTETSKNLNEILHGNIHEVSKSMTKMAGIFKAAMEITDSLFIRILGYKKKKFCKHRHINVLSPNYLGIPPNKDVSFRTIKTEKWPL